MSYRNRIAQLEREVNEHSLGWDQAKPYLPYAVGALVILLILCTVPPKWVQYRDPRTRQKKINSTKLILLWILLSSLSGGLYYLYLKKAIWR